MKAVILAAGKGTRHRKVTQSQPKPMIEFQGKPLLLHNLLLCKKYGVEEIFINVHYLADHIRGYFQEGKKYGVQIRYSFEPELLGTAGALHAFRNDLEAGPFFVLYGDNVSEYPLDELFRLQQEKNTVAAIGCHWLDDVSQSGVIECDSDGRIHRFIEKPGENSTESHWVNSGVYCLSPDIFSWIPKNYSDFGTDIFPLLIKNVECYALCLRIKVRAFDTEELMQRSLLA